jgi:hypothetical protein
MSLAHKHAPGEGPDPCRASLHSLGPARRGMGKTPKEMVNAILDPSPA